MKEKGTGVVLAYRRLGVTMLVGCVFTKSVEQQCRGRSESTKQVAVIRRSIVKIRARRFFINQKITRRSFVYLPRGLRNTQSNSFHLHSCQITGIQFNVHRKTVKWGFCCDGLPHRSRFVTTRIIIHAGKNIVTNPGSRVFQSKMTPTSMSLVDMSSVIRCERTSEKELSVVRTCVNRGRLFGNDP